MNQKQRDLLTYAQGMVEGLSWCLPNDQAEALCCVGETLEEILKIEDGKGGLASESHGIEASPDVDA
jgi:hypothetical protein